MTLAGRYTFDFVHSVEIESSWEMLTDQCHILLPANLKMDNTKLRSMIKPGDPVVIKIGFEKADTEVFNGFIVGIKPKTPIEIHCEDQMYLLKSSSITDTLKSATLKQLITKHFAGMDITYEDTQIGTFMIDKLSRARILDKLRESHGLYSFFRKGKLNIGKIYNPGTATEHSFKFQFNIQEDNLEYMRKEDMKLKVTAISNNPNGTLTEVKVGENQGEERTLNFYNMDKATLKKLAQAELDRLRYDGYHGDFTVFDEPQVFHGDIVKIEHPEESDKSGKYWVDKVVTTFGVDGYFQKITLGAKV